MDVLGKRLVRALLAERDPSLLKAAGFDPEMLGEDARSAYDWSVDWQASHGAWPTALMIEENTGVALPEEAEGLEYVADLVRRRTLSSKMRPAMEAAASEIKARDPDKALDKLRELVIEARPLGTASRILSSRGEALERLTRYREAGLAPFRGFRTQWPFLNERIQGWVAGNLHVAVAMQNTGKTWMSCIIADHALSLGKKVLFVTMEMAGDRIQRRLDSLHFRLPFGDLRDGELEYFTVKRWEEEAAKELAARGDILVADKKLVQRVGDIVSLVHEHRPSFVIVDGGYRLEGRGRGSWDKVVDVVNDLQIAAELTDLPWLVTSQLGDASETGKEPKKGESSKSMRAWNVRYGKEWVINPDVVIGMRTDAALRADRKLEVHVLKIRDAAGDDERDKFLMHFDLSKHRFDEVRWDEETLEGPAAGHEVTF